MKFTTLPIPVDDKVPEGYELIVAYAKGDEIVVPIDTDEEKDLHNCDWEGCTTFSHVVRFNARYKYESEDKLQKFENICKKARELFYDI